MSPVTMEEAFAGWLAAQQKARDMVLGAARSSALDRVEGIRYVTRITAIALSIYVENDDPMWPRLDRNLDEHARKFACDSPDTIYLRSAVAPTECYRLWGNAGQSPYTAIAIEADLYSNRPGRKGTLAQYALDEFEVAADGRFEIMLGGPRRPRNWIELPPDATNILLRQTFETASNRASAHVDIERLSGPRLARPPLTEAEFVEGLRKASLFVTNCIGMFMAMAGVWAQHLNGFRFHGSSKDKKDDQGGDPHVDYFQGYWKLAPDEALVIEFVPVPRYRFWSFMLSNYWSESFNYRDLDNVATNHRKAVAGPDGVIRLVVAHRDPGAPNWISAAGHAEGLMLLRWVLAEERPTPPVTRVVPLQSLARGPG
jgi:hypothetical protein